MFRINFTLAGTAAWLDCELAPPPLNITPPSSLRHFANPLDSYFLGRLLHDLYHFLLRQWHVLFKLLLWNTCDEMVNLRNNVTAVPPPWFWPFWHVRGKGRQSVWSKKTTAAFPVYPWGNRNGLYYFFFTSSTMTVYSNIQFVKSGQKIWAGPSPPLNWTKSKRTATFFGRNSPREPS